MKRISLTFFLTYLLMGCSSRPAATELPLPEFPTAISSVMLSTVTPSIASTPTDWLPYNPNYTADGCDEFTATLPVTGTENLSQLQITRQLFEIYLGHYRSPDLGGLCRLEDFKVEYVDDRFSNLAGEQKVDFVNTVEYSLQVAEAPTQWAAGNGEFSSDGWIIHKFLIVGVTKRDDEYILRLLGTGP